MGRNNIVICANELTQIGGISRVIHSTAKGFTERGYNVSLLGMNTIDDDRSYVGESDQSRAYPVAIAYSENPPGRRQDPEKWGRLRGEAVGYLRRYLETMDLGSTVFIILHVYVMEHLLEAGLKVGGPDDPVVFGMYHNSFEACKKVSDLRRVKASYSVATRFLALTELDRDRYASESMNNASYIYNPVELLRQPHRVPWNEREKRVVYIGRFAREKNVPRLVRHWSKVSRDFPDWKFEIYGVGPDGDDIAKTVFETGCADSVRVFGPTQEPEQLMASSRLLVMDSDYEGLPVVLVEAGLCGCPALVTNCSPGMNVLVKDSVTGRVVEAGDSEGFVGSLCEIMSDQELAEQYGVAAEGHMARFSIDRIMDDWEELFRRNGV